MAKPLSVRRGAGTLVAFVLAGASCTGVIGDNHGSTARRGGPTGGSTTGGGTGTGGPDPTCTTLQPGPTFVRRLNRFEYNNTVRDLLGDATQPANDFPTEERRNGF